MRRTLGARVSLAVITTLALAAASAQAAPGSLEFGKCVAKSGGRFLNRICTKPAKPGKELYEWEPVTSGVSSVGKQERNTGEVILDKADGVELSCTTVTQREGEFGPASKEERNIGWVFSGCSAGFAECNSAGAKAGEVVWNKLHATFGIVKREAKEEKNIVGIAFSPQSGVNDAEFECGPAPVTVRGGVIVKAQADSSGGTTGELTNKMIGKFELEFLTEKGGKQVPERFEGEPADTLEMSLAPESFEQASLAMVLVQETTSPKTTTVELRQCEMNVC